MEEEEEDTVVDMEEEEVDTVVDMEEGEADTAVVVDTVVDMEEVGTAVAAEVGAVVMLVAILVVATGLKEEGGCFWEGHIIPITITVIITIRITTMILIITTKRVPRSKERIALYFNTKSEFANVK